MGKDAAWNLVLQEHRLNSETWRAMRGFTDHVARRWPEPDAGIWAAELFEELLGVGGPLGLFSEDAEPVTGALLGNYPQALTHAALVQAARVLRDAAQEEPLDAGFRQRQPKA